MLPPVPQPILRVHLHWILELRRTTCLDLGSAGHENAGAVLNKYLSMGSQTSNLVHCDSADYSFSKFPFVLLYVLLDYKTYRTNCYFSLTHLFSHSNDWWPRWCKSIRKVNGLRWNFTLTLLQRKQMSSSRARSRQCTFVSHPSRWGQHLVSLQPCLLYLSEFIMTAANFLPPRH